MSRPDARVVGVARVQSMHAPSLVPSLPESPGSYQCGRLWYILGFTFGWTGLETIKGEHCLMSEFPPYLCKIAIFGINKLFYTLLHLGFMYT